MIGQVDGGEVDALFLNEERGYDAQQDGERARAEKLDVAFGNMYTREIVSFGESILEGRPLEVPAQDAVNVQRVVEAAYRANDEKRIVDL